MVDINDIKLIKATIEEFFSKMTIEARANIEGVDSFIEDVLTEDKQKKESVVVDIKTDDPQILIGERGQTLSEIQRILRSLVNKKIGRVIYLDLDINEYKKKKAEYLKGLAKDLANEVALTKEAKVMLPMSAYERRIIHTELADRTDVTAESEGQEPERRIVIKPK